MLLLVFSLLSSQNLDHPSSLRQEIDKAARLLEGGRYQAARDELQKLVQAHPDFYPAHVYLGIALSNLGQLMEAEESFKEALRLKPDSSSIHYNLALALLRQEKFKEGIRELERTLELDAENLEAIYNLGVVLLERGRRDEAVVYLKKADQLGFQGPELPIQLLRAYLMAGALDRASEKSDLLLTRYSRDPAVQSAAAELFLSASLPVLARSHLDRALELAPHDDAVHRLMAEAFLQEGEALRALEVLEKVSEKETGYYQARARAHGILNDLDAAAEAVEKALEQSPADVTVLLTVSRLHQKFGNQKRAVELLKTLIELDDQQPDAFYSLAVSRYILDEYETAMEELQRATALRPEFHQAHFLKALVELNRGSPAKARPHLERAVELQPFNVFYLTIYGMHLAFENDLKGAVEVFQKALSLDPGYATAYYQYGKTLVRLSQFEKAAGVLEKAVELKPDLYEAYYPLGQVYRRLGKTEKANQALDIFLKYREREKTPQEELISTGREALGP
ncbi:MAG: tetratricopeptide repeat protein [Acidobacteriota bacterium]